MKNWGEIVKKKINISEMNENELWETYKKTKDPEIREFFIKQYAPLVKYVAGKVAMGKPGNIEYEDLVGFVLIAQDITEQMRAEKALRQYAVTGQNK